MEKVTHELIRSYLGENYQPSDDQLINLYIETHEFYKRMQKELKDMDLMVKHTNKANATNYVKNPLSIEITKTVQTLNNLLKSLGLTPAQRKEINSGGGQNDDGFESF